MKNSKLVFKPETLPVIFNSQNFDKVTLYTGLWSCQSGKFWLDDISLATSRFVAPARLQGYHQVTDAHLLALALRHKARLVTIDSAVGGLVPNGFPPGTVWVVGGAVS